VRSAVVAGEDAVAVEIFTVEPSRGRWPAAARLADDLAGVMKGTLSIETKLAERARTYRNEHRAFTPHLVSTQVSVDNNASATATVVEVRAEDVVGQLHRITQALADCALDVNSAKVSTFGSAVVDAFYVRGPDGGKVTDSRRIASVEAAIRSRVAQTGSTGVH
jgi:[protein-PII] uridylyltransferase